MSTWSGYFTSDRAKKYGWGLPRLVAVTWLAFEVAPLFAKETGALGLGAYGASGRWLCHLYVGSIGAAVNVEIFSFYGNIVLLLGAAVVSCSLKCSELLKVQLPTVVPNCNLLNLSLLRGGS